MIQESPRAFSHPALITFWILACLGILLIVANVGILALAPFGIAGYAIGYWNKHMLILEQIEEAKVIGEEPK